MITIMMTALFAFANKPVSMVKSSLIQKQNFLMDSVEVITHKDLAKYFVYLNQNEVFGTPAKDAVSSSFFKNNTDYTSIVLVRQSRSDCGNSTPVLR
jgi:hypothetical protein